HAGTCDELRDTVDVERQRDPLAGQLVLVEVQRSTQREGSESQVLGLVGVTDEDLGVESREGQVREDEARQHDAGPHGGPGALEILTAIGEGRPVTQRALAQRLGVALGLTNLYVKRLARKGCIKVREFPRKPATRKRLHYLLTPKGLAEKTRLTYEHMAYSL